MSDMYLRQETPEPSSDLNVLIMGCGGMGSQIAQTLAMSGICQSIYLADGDHFETHNMNRVPLAPEKAVGTNKAVAVRERVKELRPDLTTVAYPGYLEEGMDDQINVPVDFVVMAAEGSNAHNAVEALFPELVQGDHVIYIGGEEDEVNIMLESPGWGSGSEDGGNYNDVWAGSTMGGALAVVNFMTKYYSRNHRLLRRHHSQDHHEIHNLDGRVSRLFENSQMEMSVNPVENAMYEYRNNSLHAQLESVQDMLESEQQQASGYKGYATRLKNEKEELVEELEGVHSTTEELLEKMNLLMNEVPEVREYLTDLEDSTEDTSDDEVDEEVDEGEVHAGQDRSAGEHRGSPFESEDPRAGEVIADGTESEEAGQGSWGHSAEEART